MFKLFTKGKTNKKIEIKSTKEGNAEICAGAVLGAVGLAGATVSSAICPVCAVGASFLIGLGTYKKFKKFKISKEK